MPMPRYLIISIETNYSTDITIPISEGNANIMKIIETNYSMKGAVEYLSGAYGANSAGWCVANDDKYNSMQCQLPKNWNRMRKIREKRLRWFGHIKRRERNHSCKEILQYQPLGRRPAGRPNMSWLKVVKKDLATRRLTERHALNRELWKEKTQHPDPV
ncbi:hypothetical protein PRIPAC_73721 [Pristionchus pacificus]|uniref:Uncharacterized protein n=1 Tax=Pristionchus pacificus TaxID=54126 RepID=A0A2A6BRT8_PRIPA|nr:hypothetical protein PRIPAC_73721 [Pristionchus pacificus]|eukprot:PDM68536.1 hypothetical protein PRIPAC_44038 [Pristionchus pacificus]